MAKNQRQERLLGILARKKTAKIAELIESVKSSPMTIHRDLEWLEKNGIVKRHHGGVTLIRNDAGQPSFHERVEEFNDEKYVIGKQAAKLIQPGAIVFFDAGTTPLAVTEHIPDNLEFTAITTGLLTAAAMCGKTSVNVIHVGGNIHQSSYSSVNYMAVDSIKNFHADLAFISTKSVILPDGTYEAHLPLIEVKEAIVQSADRVVLLADNSKFETKSMCKAIPLEAIDLIISDSKLSSVHLSRLEQLGKETIIADINEIYNNFKGT